MTHKSENSNINNNKNLSEYYKLLEEAKNTVTKQTNDCIETVFNNSKGTGLSDKELIEMVTKLLSEQGLSIVLIEKCIDNYFERQGIKR